MSKFSLIDHYRKLVFFNFNRFKGNNYQAMREYLAGIAIMDIEKFILLNKKKILDVGGARGEFCKIFSEKRKCKAINIDPYPGDYIWPNTKVGFADEMPFNDNAFDLTLCRGVLEHIPNEKQQKSVNEIYRVTKAGGIGYIIIPPWYNPHAGHYLKPFHLLPFKIAKFLRQLIFRNKISANSYAEAGLYPITFRKMSNMISKSGFKLIATKDTHFRLHFLTKIPLIREILVPAVTFIVKKEK